MMGAFLASTVSFPGLGIGEFSVNSEAFSIPLPWSDEPHGIMWYGIIIALAMVAGFCVSLRKSKHEGIKSDNMFDLAIYLIIFCMIGARLYYVLSKPGDYKTFTDIIAVWNGGLAIYGGIIAGAVTILVYTRIKKIKTAKLLDVAVPGLLLGQAIGRWGNFMNVEAYGSVTTLPWRMCSPKIAGELLGKGLIDQTQSADILAGTLGVHPTFLYESLWNIIGFVLVMLLYKRKKYDGHVTLFYLVWYGVGRFLIEGLRTDSLYLLENVFGQTIRVSQLVAALCVVGGVIAMAVAAKRVKYKKLDEAEYEEVYASKADTLGLDDAPAYEVKQAGEETVDKSIEAAEEASDSDTDDDTQS